MTACVNSYSFVLYLMAFLCMTLFWILLVLYSFLPTPCERLLLVNDSPCMTCFCIWADSLGKTVAGWILVVE